jgi:hypothetical protein
MRRKLLLLAAIALAAALVLPSVAAPGGDQAGEGITLSPHAGPNGAYAVMDDGNLTLRFDSANPNVTADGVNANAVTPIDRIFVVNYTGPTQATVWLESDVSQLRFYRDDEPSDSLEGRSNGVVLQPGERIAVGVEIDTRDGRQVEATDQFVVHAEVDDPESDDPGPSGPGPNDDGDDDNPPTSTPEPTTTDDDGETATETATPDGPPTSTDDGSGPGGSGGTTTVPVETTAAPAEDPGESPADDPGDKGAFSGLAPFALLLLLLVLVLTAWQLTRGGE